MRSDAVLSAAVKAAKWLKAMWIAGRVSDDEYADDRICACGNQKPIDEDQCFAYFCDEQRRRR